MLKTRVPNQEAVRSDEQLSLALCTCGYGLVQLQHFSDRVEQVLQGLDPVREAIRRRLRERFNIIAHVDQQEGILPSQTVNFSCIAS